MRFSFPFLSFRVLIIGVLEEPITKVFFDLFSLPLIVLMPVLRVGGLDEDVPLGPDGLPVTVEEDRRHLVEAVIVRTMKARRTLSHNDLVAETTRQLAYLFTPSTTVHA